MESIKLNDILRLENLNNVKIRFNLMFRQNWNPIEVFKNGDISVMLEGQYWNYNKRKSYKEGQITVGLVKLKPKEDFWLLFHVGEVTKDLNRLNGVGYEYQNLPEYDKYLGRDVYKRQAKIPSASRYGIQTTHKSLIRSLRRNRNI